MKEFEVTQVTYTALGKEHVTYTKSTDLTEIVDCIQLIIDTARLIDTRRVNVTAAVFQENNLKHIREWYAKIGPSSSKMAEAIENRFPPPATK